MRFKLYITLFVIIFSIAMPSAFAQNPDQGSINEIIRRFAAAESENKIARNNYTFTQDVDLATLGEAGSITGRYKRVSEIVFDDRSNRIERITYFPPSTLAVTMTQEDLQDLAGVQPFALTLEDLPKYNVTYAGKERLDELNTHVFDVSPRQIRKGERYLEGRIWVDDVDLQIVKVAGKGVPETDNNKFPRFETYRENIDGKYWFPTYTYADDVLDFKRNPIRLRMTIRYTNYKKFSTDIRLLDDGEVADTPEETEQKKKDEQGKEKSPDRPKLEKRKPMPDPKP